MFFCFIAFFFIKNEPGWPLRRHILFLLFSLLFSTYHEIHSWSLTLGMYSSISREPLSLLAILSGRIELLSFWHRILGQEYRIFATTIAETVHSELTLRLVLISTSVV